MRFFPWIFFFFHFRRRSRLSTRNNTPSSVESIIECICLFVYSFDISSALRERESKREKNGDILKLVVVKRHLVLFSQKTFSLSVNKRSARSKNYKRFYCFFALVLLFFFSSRVVCVVEEGSIY